MALYLCLLGRRDGGSIDRERAAARPKLEAAQPRSDFDELLGKDQPRCADLIAGALRPRLGVDFDGPPHTKGVASCRGRDGEEAGGESRSKRDAKTSKGVLVMGYVEVLRAAPWSVRPRTRGRFPVVEKRRFSSALSDQGLRIKLADQRGLGGVRSCTRDNPRKPPPPPLTERHDARQRPRRHSGASVHQLYRPALRPLSRRSNTRLRDEKALRRGREAAWKPSATSRRRLISPGDSTGLPGAKRSPSPWSHPRTASNVASGLSA
jgi:hypothetical protein